MYVEVVKHKTHIEITEGTLIPLSDTKSVRGVETHIFQMTVWLTVCAELSVVPPAVTSPCSFSQTMTSSLVTQVALLCSTCFLLAAALSKHN